MSSLNTQIQLRLIEFWTQFHCEAFRKLWRQRDSYNYTRMYQLWYWITQSCSNPSHRDYPNCGGRGVKVDRRWLGMPEGFIRFVLDMGVRPKNLAFSRIDRNGDYTPSNCRWITRLGISNNRRDNLRVTVFGAEMSLQEACRIYDIHPAWAYQRLFVYSKPWSPERTFSTPTNKKYRDYLDDVRREAARKRNLRKNLALQKQNAAGNIPGTQMG